MADISYPAGEHRHESKPRLGARIRVGWDMAKTALHDLAEDKAFTLAAALSYYSLLSLAPLLLIIIALAGKIFGAEAVSGRLVEEMRGLIGEQGAQLAQTVVAHAHDHERGGLATAIGIVTLLVGATGVFLQLQNALNTVWEVEPKPGSGLRGFIRNRLLSLGAVGAIGFLLLVSLVVSAVISVSHQFVSSWIGELGWLWQTLNFVVSIGLFSLLFAILFKWLPDVEIEWRDVWVGAIVTAVLFGVGKQLIGVYLGRGAVGSAYGAAGSVIIFVVWVYYSSVIVFLGAELTQVYARSRGARIVPAEYAVSTEGRSR